MRPDLIEFGDGSERMALDDIRRRLQHQRAQHIRDRLEPRLIGVEPCASRVENFATSSRVLPPPTFR